MYTYTIEIIDHKTLQHIETRTGIVSAKTWKDARLLVSGLVFGIYAEFGISNIATRSEVKIAS